MEATLAISALSNGRQRDEGEEEERIRTDARKRVGSKCEYLDRPRNLGVKFLCVSMGHWESKKRQRYEDQQSAHQELRLR